jgi:hypothetical protein
VDGNDLFAVILIGLMITMCVGISYDCSTNKPFTKYGVCTGKHIAEDGNCWVRIGYDDYKIAEKLYDGMIVGEGYDVSGKKGVITTINKYAEDSGL